jgi:hypothetical protein
MDPFHYFLSINVRFGQFTFGPVKFSYVVAQMACKFQIPMGGREGLIDTAVKTAETGNFYLFLK